MVRLRVTGRLRAAADTVTAILANRSLRQIEGAFLGFNLSEYGTWVALLVYAHDATGSASVGFVALAQLIPAAAYAPIAASLGDRYPRIRVLFGGYVLIALSSLAVAAAMTAGAPAFLTYACAMVASASMTMPRPLQAAITPAFAETPEQLATANGINAIFEGLGVLVGPLGAGILMAIGSPALVFLAGGIVSAVSALLIANLGIANLGIRRRTVPGAEAVGPLSAGRALVSGFAGPSLLEGVRAIAHDRSQLLIAVVLAARFVVVGALDVILVLLATEALRIDGAGAGFFTAALGFGGVLGGALTLVVVGRRRLATWILAGAAGTGAALAMVALVPWVGVILTFLAGSGIGLACVDVAGRTLLQRIGQREALAEAFGVVEGLAMLGLAVGSVGASLLYSSVGLTAALAATAGFLPAIALVSLAWLSRAERMLELPADQIALLRHLPLFARVPAPSLEAAARRLVHFNVPAHAIVFREGDPGDRFYVIASGSVEISQNGVAVRTLGPGASFGEIALLRTVARTASVVGVTDVELWGLDRDGFLLAITGSRQAVADAHARTEAMLAADRARA
jgi:MFS family permease